MKFFLFPMIFLSCIISSNLAAQEKPNDGKESFYRAIKHSDLITMLPPRGGSQDSLFGGNFFEGNGNCPNEINIGSITEDTPIFGSIDIELFIDSDIIIVCN